ncbi:hypothetical protein TGPRC2_427590 [Toxoplasma gondii TgCatPRC2]|uniref:Uncharacterized protein n=1 Tax=Toxoplasma gondii TgCatPRC2 TaxID=1130821 RepID=A0A151GYV2_TOXGO|nr:hypothetical protein TGPRC2_427590 [Toxoplasma gondii TgCatPRC2]
MQRRPVCLRSSENLQVAVLEIRRKGCESIQDDARRAPKQKWTQLKAPSYCLCLQALVYDVLNIATSSFTKLLANKEEDEDAIRENTFQ